MRKKIDKLKPESDNAEVPADSVKGAKEPTVEPLDEPIGDSSVEAPDSIEEMNEDVPIRPAPKRNVPRFREAHPSDKDAEGCHCYDSSFPRGKLPPPPVLQQRELEDDQKPKPKQGKDGIDKAMDIIDQYYENVPMGSPNRED